MKHIDSHEATIEFVSAEHVQHVDTGRQRCSISICHLCVNMVRGVTSELSFHQRSFTAEDGKSLDPDMIDVVVEAAPLGLTVGESLYKCGFGDSLLDLRPRDKQFCLLFSNFEHIQKAEV